MPTNIEVKEAVQEAVETEIQWADEEQMLSYDDYDEIKRSVSDEVFLLLLNEGRSKLTNTDVKGIRGKVMAQVDECLTRPPVKSRYELRDRLVCRIGGAVGWAAGTIQSLDEPDPSDQSGRTILPYVVKLDAPISKLISVPRDTNDTCFTEVCFGQNPDAILFALKCKPQRKAQNGRFAVGDRVTCAVADATGDYTVWAPGQVCDVNYDVETEATALGLRWNWANRAGIMPYRVLLDSGLHVLVHRDEHWLLRDLALQPAAPRQAQDGSRNLKRLVKRRHCDAEGSETGQWELIDHATRRVRIEAAGGQESDSDE